MRGARGVYGGVLGRGVTRCSYCPRSTERPTTKWLSWRVTDVTTNVVSTEWRCPKCKEAMWRKFRAAKVKRKKERVTGPVERLESWDPARTNWQKS